MADEMEEHGRVLTDAERSWCEQTGEIPDAMPTEAEIAAADAAARVNSLAEAVVLTEEQKKSFIWAWVLPCPHCTYVLGKDDDVTMCDNACGTIVCDQCNKEWHPDDAWAPTKGHDKTCGDW